MEWIETFNELKTSQIEFTVAMIVETKGSTPREEGTRLFILKDRSFKGTIGGGELETKVLESSKDIFKTQKSQLIDYKLPSCNGAVKVFFEYIAPSRELIIFGDGNVGRALERVMSDTSFKIKVIGEPYIEAIKDLNLNSDSYIVLVSYSHATDEEILLNLIDREFKYLGIIGSESKAKSIYKLLETKGVKKEIIDKIYSPIGLKEVKGKLPSEIAISIAGQLLSIK